MVRPVGTGWTVVVVGAASRPARHAFVPGWIGALLGLWIVALPLGGLATGWCLRAAADDPWTSSPFAFAAATGRALWSGDGWLPVSAAAVPFRVTPSEPPRPAFSDDVAGARRLLEARRTESSARAAELGLGTMPAASQLLIGRVEQEWVEAAGGIDRTPGTLHWPIEEGWFTRGYGSGEDGYHQAIDIMGEYRAEVRASAGGIVGYAGEDIRGYGKTVLIVHPGGWVTMYAHNAANLVAAGQRVRRGQLIAELGSTGISRGPHVHYEFLYAGRQCDPSLLFRPGIRHRSGHLTPVEHHTWTVPGDRPREVDCNRRRRHPHSRWVSDPHASDAPRPADTLDG